MANQPTGWPQNNSAQKAAPQRGEHCAFVPSTHLKLTLPSSHSFPLKLSIDKGYGVGIGTSRLATWKHRVNKATYVL